MGRRSPRHGYARRLGGLFRSNRSVFLQHQTRVRLRREYLVHCCSPPLHSSRALWFPAHLRLIRRHRSHEQEYNDPAHAKEAVAKYNEGHFLGAQIKVEFSLARAPESSSKGGSEPPTPYSANAMPPLLGAPPSSTSGCFVCGSPDHWARECPDADKMPLRNPPGSDRPSDARKPMWINGCVLFCLVSSPLLRWFSARSGSVYEVNGSCF